MVGKNLPEDVVAGLDLPGQVCCIPGIQQENLDMMITYFKWCLKMKYLTPSELLLLDLGPHKENKSDELLHWLSDKKIHYLHYPAQAGSLLSPNDNSFHAVFKRHYYTAITSKARITPKQKIQLILEAYDKVSDTTVINYFKHCGLLKHSNRGGVADILKQGVSEWPRMSERWQTKHHQSVEAYLEFRKTRTTILHGDLDTKSPLYLHNTTLETVRWYIS